MIFKKHLLFAAASFDLTVSIQGSAVRETGLFYFNSETFKGIFKLRGVKSPSKVMKLI